MGTMFEQTFDCPHCKREIHVLSFWGAVAHEIWCAGKHNEEYNVENIKTTLGPA